LHRAESPVATIGLRLCRHLSGKPPHAGFAPPLAARLRVKVKKTLSPYALAQQGRSLLRLGCIDSSTHQAPTLSALFAVMARLPPMTQYRAIQKCIKVPQQNNSQMLKPALLPSIMSLLYSFYIHNIFSEF